MSSNSITPDSAGSSDSLASTSARTASMLSRASRIARKMAGALPNAADSALLARDTGDQLEAWRCLAVPQGHEVDLGGLQQGGR
jgi:hypothetical protein